MEKTDAVWCIHQWEWLSDCDVSTAVTQRLLRPSNHTPCLGTWIVGSMHWTEMLRGTLGSSLCVNNQSLIQGAVENHTNSQAAAAAAAARGLLSSRLCPLESHWRRENFHSTIKFCTFFCHCWCVHGKASQDDVQYKAWNGGICRPAGRLELFVTFLGLFLNSLCGAAQRIVLLGDQCHVGARLTWERVWANGLCQSAFTRMPGSGVSRQNIALWWDGGNKVWKCGNKAFSGLDYTI